jgi:hypothetical protein
MAWGIFGSRRRQEARQQAQTQADMQQAGAAVANLMIQTGVGPAPYSTFAVPALSTGVASGMARDAPGSFFDAVGASMVRLSSIAFSPPATPMQAAVQQVAMQQQEQQAQEVALSSASGPFWFAPVVAIAAVVVVGLGALAYALTGRRRR